MFTENVHSLSGGQVCTPPPFHAGVNLQLQHSSFPPSNRPWRRWRATAPGERATVGSQVMGQGQLQGNSRPQTVQGEGKGLANVSLPTSSNSTVISKIVPVLSCRRQELWGCIWAMVIVSQPGHIRLFLSMRAPLGSCRCRPSLWNL